jgi:sugar lactone lactonase YvrE
VQRFVSRPVTDRRYDHAEGPTWDSRSGRLAWVDLHVGRLHIGEWRGERVAEGGSYEVGEPLGAAVPRRSGGWLLAAGRGFAVLDEDGTVRRMAQPAADMPGDGRMNDGKCDRQGRFWAGSMADDDHPGSAALYRVDTDATVSTALDGLTVSNGLDWTDDGRTMYFIDTPTRRIDAFAVTEDGRLQDRRPVVEIPEDAGLPDGMTLDAEGTLWVALWGGRAVRRYASDGTLLAVVEVDAEQVSSCCFGGPELDVLFITTSQEGMDRGERAADSQAGRLFAANVGVRGRPAHPFVGG